MLKHSPHQSRILFLKLFTRELLVNSKPKIEVIEKPEVEKAEQKTEEKVKEEKTAPVEPIKEELIPSIMSAVETTKKSIPIEIISPIVLKKPTKKPFFKPIVKSTKLFQPPALTPVPKIMQPKPVIPVISTPEGEVNLGNLNTFLLDKAVTEIECPGPGKFILVRKAGQVNLTKITLSQEEINDIINNFSEKARIPVISGIFKASVENLTIIAIISEFVGSRFIIHRESPYSLLDQQQQRIQQAQLQARLMHKRAREKFPF